MHTIQDSASPMHVDENGLPKQWNPLWPFGHSPNESIGSETAKQLTPEILRRQRQRLIEAYRRVFCKK